MREFVVGSVSHDLCDTRLFRFSFFLRRRDATDEHFGKGLVGFLVARPLIAVVIAAVVVGVLLLRRPTARRRRSPTVWSASGLPTHSRCSSGARSTRRRSAKTGRESSRPAGVLPGQRAPGGSRLWPRRQTGLRLEGHVAAEERGKRLLPAGRQDRRLHGHPAADPKRRRARDRARPRSRPCTAEHVAERIERQHLTRSPRIIAAASRSRPSYVHVVALLGVGGAPASLPFSRTGSEADHIGRSTWRERDTTRGRRSPSGSACCGRPRARSRPSSRATTQATNTGWSYLTKMAAQGGAAYKPAKGS